MNKGIEIWALSAGLLCFGQSHAGEIIVIVSGAATDAGVVACALYDSAEGFPLDRSMQPDSSMDRSTVERSAGLVACLRDLTLWQLCTTRITMVKRIRIFSAFRKKPGRCLTTYVQSCVHLNLKKQSLIYRMLNLLPLKSCFPGNRGSFQLSCKGIAMSAGGSLQLRLVLYTVRVAEQVE